MPFSFINVLHYYVLNDTQQQQQQKQSFHTLYNHYFKCLLLFFHSKPIHFEETLKETKNTNIK